MGPRRLRRSPWSRTSRMRWRRGCVSMLRRGGEARPPPRPRRAGSRRPGTRGRRRGQLRRCPEDATQLKLWHASANLSAATGERAGKPIRRERAPRPARPRHEPAIRRRRPLHARFGGFDLHAARRVGRDDRTSLERLCAPCCARRQRTGASPGSTMAGTATRSRRPGRTARPRCSWSPSS